MLHLHDRATMARALTLDLDPQLHQLLADRIATLGPDLVDCTEYLLIEPGDAEEDIIRHVGFSPLVEPIDGGRYGGRAFHPYWDYLAKHDRWYEMIFTFGSSFAYVLLIEESDAPTSELTRMCKNYL